MMMYSEGANLTQYLTAIAEQVGGIVENNSIILKGAMDEGSIRILVLEEGLIMVLTEIKSNLSIADLELNIPPDYLFLKLYLPDSHLDTMVKYDLKYDQITTPGVLLYNSHVKLKSLFKIRQRFKIVSFVLHADWLKKTFHGDSIFSEHQLFDLPLFKFEHIKPAILQSALNLFTLKIDEGPVNLRMKAIAYDLLSHLFSAFDVKPNSNRSALKHQSDIEAVFRVREQLLDMEEMNYPTIDVLAKQAGMSASKLKTLFHSVFDMPIFEFYQYHRLGYARNLIEGRKLTIGEVGLKIGYNNLSKFSQAYKRQFGYLPHQTLLPDRAIN